ncbi:MAG: aminotransferase class V-fold PLP-dependent enzyme [Legionellales bacterium]|nr:aminotransferase class V-fold PLP-dependent enzyme [Legionellales bacterium]
MNSNTPIYLDYMSSTPMDNRVSEVMIPYFSDLTFGNPHSQHFYGKNSMYAIKAAQSQIAGCINSHPEEIVFTSGATESNNLAIKGASNFYSRKGKHIITSAIEHKAVLEPIQWLVDEHGFSVTVLKPNKDGLIDVQDIKEAINEQTILISIMHVNNEIGVIQPIEEIGDLAEKKGIIFHVDAAQSIGKLAIDVKKMKVGLMSFSSHKAYGPMGIGALYVRKSPRVRLEECVHGGGQQSSFRSGTLPTGLIVGMGKAFEIAKLELQKDSVKTQEMYELLLKELLNIDGIVIHGCVKNRVPNNINISVDGIDIESLLCSLRELAISTTSACATSSQEGSYVLRALGCKEDADRRSIRISIGRFTSFSDIHRAVEILKQQVLRLRKISGWGINGV